MKGFFYIITIFCLSSLIITGCAKEYSYEGGPLPAKDTVIQAAPKPWVCPGCIGKDVFSDSHWSLYADSTFYCGIIDTAIVTPERNGFTFFGPSTCSIDSGMVITVNLTPIVLNQDLFNVTVSNVGFYYYDNTTQTYALVTRSGIPFSITIESYIHQTKVATGTFSGFVFRRNGAMVNLNRAKYKVKLI